MNPHYVEGDELRESVWMEVRTILMEHWDPIGICGEPNATNEYDSYIPNIIALLRARASVEVMLDYLDWVASERMGFISQRERARTAVARLLRLT